jgi:acyl carrier protein
VNGRVQPAEAAARGVLSRLQGIFRDVFGLPELVLSEGTTTSDIPGWDSLANINLIFAIETAYGIKFALGEMQELGDVGELARLIARKTAGSGSRGGHHPPVEGHGP